MIDFPTPEKNKQTSMAHDTAGKRLHRVCTGWGGHSDVCTMEVNMAAQEGLTCQCSPWDWLESGTLPEHTALGSRRFKLKA